MTRHISQPWTNFLCAGSSFLDCSSKISRPDMIYQNSWLQTFFDTCYCMGHRLKLNLFLFTQFCSMLMSLIEKLIILRQIRTKNLKYRLVSHTVDDYFQQEIAQKNLNWISKHLQQQCRFLLGFQNIAFHLQPIWQESQATEVNLYVSSIETIY